MKALIYLSIICLLLNSCGDNIKRQQELIEKEQKHKFDSIHSIITNNYIIERDSFSNGIPEIIYPKNKPKSVRKDYLWSYFEIEEGKAKRFRLVIQGSEVEKVSGTTMFCFNIDNKIVKIIVQPYMAHESYKGSYYDIPSAYAVDFLDSLQIGSNVKMKVTNLEEYTTRTISSEELNSIFKTYQYYKELGGEIDAPDIKDN
jgi:hypothetical protein|nr:MAG TPA: Protein involved in gliding motility 9 Secretion System Type.5A [Caudoviricetes sp.]